LEINIEDHYFDRTDAAVVFRRGDRWTGDKRYLYHGNDGTSFPWNDTAQLNYLKPEVREAVIQTILHVARLFPIIRFDAAMTLTKQHYQRLWFPVPGSGGAIPSRAEHGMSKADFDAAMPNEFWREVVDRVAQEVPGTLLLAEAFWLLEGYFVRTLGMHRVYNSAFMNMLRDEENANYRIVLKNTLEFDPDVLKRYVNFMNNPDERTALDQFGKGDKYFGVCLMMATLPGLPMFGHGQVEGFSERYGMEYRRAYRDEEPDTWMVARHEREIAPLLHRRALFAEVRDFLLYDFFTSEGWVNEDVFAYSNRLGEERALVVFHNRYADTRGWIRTSARYAEKLPEGGKRLRQRTLGDSFGLSRDPAMLVAYRDAFTGLEYLHRAVELADKGLYIELGAYKCSVLLDWRDLRDDGMRPWSALCDMLAGRGVSSLQDALHMLELKPIHDALRALADPKRVQALAEYVSETGTPESEITRWIEDAARRVRTLLQETDRYLSSAQSPDPESKFPQRQPKELDAAAQQFERRLRLAIRIPTLEQYFSQPWPEQARAVLPTPTTPPADVTVIWSTIVTWCALEALGRLQHPAEPNAASTGLFDRLRLRGVLAELFAAAGLEGEKRWQVAARQRAAFACASLLTGPEPVLGRPAPAPFGWLHDPDLAWLVGVHEYEGVRYLVKESFERLLWWIALRPLLEILEPPKIEPETIRALERRLKSRIRAVAEKGYRVEALLEPEG
jgi:hypothetical protein